MESCSTLCSAFAQFSWGWLAVATVVVFAIGALWYSLLFAKAWVRVFKIEMPQNGEKPKGMVATMLMQLLATILFGLTIFVATAMSVGLAVLVVLAFCGWQKGALKFRYAKWSEFSTAAIIEVGHTAISGLVFILFALI